MNINGHEVERMDTDSARLRIDGRSTGWWADKDVTYYECRAENAREQAEQWDLIAEFRRRELAEQEQAARDADLDRRAGIARQKWIEQLGAPPIADTATRWREVIRALDADAAERGADA